MKKLIFLGAVFIILAPRIALSAGESAVVHKMFKECIDSGGEAASNYNDWVAQNGCKCGGSSIGSGNRTCNKNSGSLGNTDLGALLGTLPAEQQLKLLGASIGFRMIMEGLSQSARQAEQREEQRRAEAEARLAEQKRLAEERERQTEEAKQRLLSELKGLDASSQLALMGIDSSPSSSQLALMGIDSAPSLSLMNDDLQVKETRGAFGVKELKPIIGEETHPGMNASQGFDTTGKIMGSNLPRPPAAPTTWPVGKMQIDKAEVDYNQAVDEYAKAIIRRQQLEEEKKMAERIRQEAEKKYLEQQAHIALIPQDKPAVKQEEDDMLAQAEKLLKEATDLDEKASQDLSTAEQYLEQAKLDLDRTEKARVDADKNRTQTEPGESK